MTPAQHGAAAERMIAILEAKPTTRARAPEPFDFEAARIHATLARAIGTGDHYARATELLATYDETKTDPRFIPADALRLTRAAALHAELADRA